MKRKSPEDDAQAAVVSWLRANDYTVIAALNGVHLKGGKLTRIRQWARFVRLGALAGSPDLIIVEPAPLDGHSTAIEMKSKTGSTSKIQKAVHAKMRAAGWHLIVGRGADNSILQLMAVGYGVRR